MIPKTIHQIWIEGAVSEEDRGYAESLRQINEGWEVVLWAGDAEANDGGPWSEVRALPEATNPHLIKALEDRMPQRGYFLASYSDVLRAEILARHGGVYLDTDVFGVRPLDAVILDSTRLAVAAEHGNKLVGNFMIAAEAGHPALWQLIYEFDNRMAWYFTAQSRRLNPVGITGPIVVGEVLTPYCDCTLFPWPLFSPWNQEYDFPEDWREIEWPSSTVCVHTCGSRWSKEGRAKKVAAKAVRDGIEPTWKAPVHVSRRCCQ